MILDRFSLKNKIFLSCLSFILLVSIIIALFTRWLLISSLTGELQKRGTGIAEGVADSSRVHILTKNRAELTALAFNTKSGNKKDIVNYLIISDEYGKILAHTFIKKLPGLLKTRVAKPPMTPSEITELHVGGHRVFHVSIPVKEGLYTIGAVHIGLAKEHIQTLIEKLRFLFLTFLSAVTILFFMLSHWLAHLITKPVSSLINYTDRITGGDYDITFPGKNTTGVKDKKIGQDEIGQLTNSFVKMTSRIRSSRKKIMESESKYKSLFISGPNPIFVLEKKSLDILDANPKAVELFGYRKAELPGMNFLKLGNLEPDTFLREYPEEKAAIISSKVKFYKKDGSSIFVNIHAAKAEYRTLNALIVATTDITELVEKDSQLIQATKISNLEQMSVGIAHELNQPLNAIKMGSEYLSLMCKKNRPVEMENLFMVSTEISTQVTRAAQIINRLKNFSRKSDFSREIVNINNCIKSVNKIIGRQISLQNIELTLRLDDRIPPVLAHNNRIEQVVFNLITNARDAVNQKFETGQGKNSGEIIITTESRKNAVKLSITDNGTGIEQPHLEKIFESFYTTKKMGEGMGLGLPIIKGIIKDFNGRIEVESTPDKGSTFKVIFPAHNPAAS